MNVWGISYGNDGFHVRLERVPLWKIAVARTADWVLGVALRHRLCCRAPEVLWKVPMGRPRFYADDPDMLENSVAGMLWNVSTRAIGLDYGGAASWISVTEDVARTLVGDEWVDDVSREEDA